LRLTDLAVGADGRNRVMLSPFQSRTGRNQPSNAKFIFGHSVWMRRLIKPAPGWSVAYVDWEQQEFGIGAALSGDPVKMAAYQSGDPYFAFAQLAGAIPRDAISTDRAHKAVRDRFKTCVLGIDYGMELHTLALRIGQPPIYARDMIEAYRETFSVFWAWADRVVGHAQLRGYLTTVKGWPLYLPRADQLGSRDKPITPRSLRNFPMQANGAEMLRLACCLATERGIPVCAPVHDAVMLYAPTPEIGRHVAAMQAAMAEASREILNGFELRTEAKTFDYPRRYDGDSRGDTMWNTVNALAAELEHSAA
jgi:DNA polymerase I